MLFKEFGNKNMLDGGGISWWSWKPQIEALKKDFYIITPIIDGLLAGENNVRIPYYKKSSCPIN